MKNVLTTILVAALSVSTLLGQAAWPLGQSYTVQFPGTNLSGSPASFDASGPGRCDVYRGSTGPLAISGAVVVMGTTTTNWHEKTLALTSGNGFVIGDDVNINCGGMVGGIYVAANKVNLRIVAAENTTGVPVSDVTRINNVATTSVTTIAANVGTTQPLNFTGTAGAALVKTDVLDWNGSAVGASATAGYPVVTIRDGTGTGEIDTNAGAIAHVVLTDTASGVTNNVGGNVAGNVNGTVGGMTATGIANTFFLTNSGTTYASAVSGSPVAEIANNAGMGSASFALVTGTSDSGTTTTMVDAARTEAD